jgi:4-hydroxyphenylacetate 3-monooxygenase
MYARQAWINNKPVQEKLSQLAVYREGINAHLTAAIAMAEKSPNDLLMPNQSLLLTGRVHACSNLPAMMHIAREIMWWTNLCDARLRLFFRSGEAVPGSISFIPLMMIG